VNAIGKRVLDVVVASLALVLMSPLILGFALAVAATLGSPVMVRQMRPDLGGSEF